MNAKQARYARQLIATTLKTRAALKARPWTVKSAEGFAGRYATESEASIKATAIGGTYTYEKP